MFWANFQLQLDCFACCSEQVVSAFETVEREVDEASITCKSKTKSYILSLCSGNCLVKECIQVILIPSASWIALDHSIELSKDVWKRKMTTKRKYIYSPPSEISTVRVLTAHCSCCSLNSFHPPKSSMRDNQLAVMRQHVLAVPCTATRSWPELRTTTSSSLSCCSC